MDDFIGLKIDPDRKLALEHIAAQRRTTISELVRDALDQHFDFERAIPEAKNFFAKNGEPLTTRQSAHQS